MIRLKKDICINLAIELLEKIGVEYPAQEQINLVESILMKAPLFQHICFNAKLTSREISCLYWAAMGQTATETARFLNIQPSTVEQHRQEIKKKLGCKTITEAVFRGM